MSLNVATRQFKMTHVTHITILLDSNWCAQSLHL